MMVVDVKELSSSELLSLLGSTLHEVWSRHDNGGDIAVLKNGKVVFRRCPDCGRKITVFNVCVNHSDEDLKLAQDRWPEMLRMKRAIPPGWDYANVPCKQGKWVTAYCDCHARDEWFGTQSEAVDFYMRTFHGINEPIFIYPKASKEGGKP